MAKKTDDVIEGLRGLGFRSTPEAIRALLDQATKHRLSPVQTCEKLVLMERTERDARNLHSRTRAATLGTFKPLDRFDWEHPKKIDRPLYEHLLTMDFIDQAHNVLFRGASGIGKTMLAQNLALVALQQGYTVRFTTLAAALADLLKQESLPALERRLKRYTLPSLLILDEIGYVPCDSRSADLLYNIISRRHEVRSTVITTNLAFKRWGTVFPGAACVAALVDRFVQHCHILDIDAESWREKESRDFSPPTKAKKARSSKQPRTSTKR
jgi:DNA replication protein DnaC